MSHYTENVIKWTYHHVHRGSPDPTQKRLEDWDETLFGRYDTHLVDVMGDRNISLTKPLKSTIVLLAQLSKGRPKQKVKQACDYYEQVTHIQIS